MDTRRLKNEQIRLRFKLSQMAYDLVTRAFRHTGYKYNNAALDAISLNFICSDRKKVKPRSNVIGSQRLLVKLYPDQYEVVLAALEVARKLTLSDEAALVLVCGVFLTDYPSPKLGCKPKPPGLRNLNTGPKVSPAQLIAPDEFS